MAWALFLFLLNPELKAMATASLRKVVLKPVVWCSQAGFPFTSTRGKGSNLNLSQSKAKGLPDAGSLPRYALG